MGQSLEFRQGLSARETHRSLQAAARNYETARQHVILWFGELNRRKLYQDLGYATILMYAEAQLGWSKSKTYDFLKICQKLDKLPQVKKGLESGELGYASTRNIVAVATPRNEGQWVDLARKKPHREVKAAVKKARRKARDQQRQQPSLLDEAPTPPARVMRRVTLEMTPTQLARYEALWQRLRKQGGLPGDRIEALLLLLERQASVPAREQQAAARQPGDAQPTNAQPATSQAGDILPGDTQPGTTPPPAPPPDTNRPPSGSHPSAQIHLLHCPACGRTTTQTRRGELELPPAEAERHLCDAVISQPGRRNRATIPPRIRQLVLERSRFRCQAPGCAGTQYLEVHHIIPRSRGGTNHPENLRVLCSACHAQAHRHPVRKHTLAKESTEKGARETGETGQARPPPAADRGRGARRGSDRRPW